MNRFKKNILIAGSAFAVVMLSADFLYSQQDADASKQFATTAPSIPPLTKNIFFPSGRFAPRGKYGMLEDEFILSATAISDTKSSALLSYPVNNTTRWIKEGDFVGDMLVSRITSGGIEIYRFGRTLTLSIGSAGSSLEADKRIFTDSFQLVGVCVKQGLKFAVVKPGNENSAYNVRNADFIGSGFVSKIDNDSITLTYAGRDYIVPVGGRFTPEGKVQ